MNEPNAPAFFIIHCLLRLVLKMHGCFVYNEDVRVLRKYLVGGCHDLVFLGANRDGQSNVAWISVLVVGSFLE